MKQLKNFLMGSFRRTKYALALLTLYVLVPAGLYAMFQGEGEPAATSSLPFILFLPYLIGIFVHWLKKYTLDGLVLGLGAYLLQNLAGTITSIVVGLGSLATMYASAGHGGLEPVTLGSWIAAFWVGLGADTINSGMTKNQPAA